MNGKRNTNGKNKRNGFYLALAVCMVAVGIAAWSTYDAVNGYLQADSSSSSSLSEEQNREVASGQQTPSLSAAEDPEGSRPAQGVNGQVASKPQSTPAPTPEPTPAPTPTPPPVVETAGEPEDGVIYQISTAMVAPLESGEERKAYSAGAPVYSETMRDWRIHAGVDFSAQPNEAVRSCANGQVKEFYTDDFLGNVLVVEHGDYLFYYCGVGEQPLVQVGDVVTKGQEIAQVTAVPSESAEEPHLHLEVKRDNVYLNPSEVLSAQG